MRTWRQSREHSPSTEAGSELQAAIRHLGYVNAAGAKGRCQSVRDDAILHSMGTDAWRNWRSFSAGELEIENLDDELHSDRHFTGGPVSFGPFTLSTIIQGGVSRAAPPTVGPAIRLHVGVHANLIPDLVVDNKLVPANSDAYHGGNASDEIAALASLTLGVRIRVAGTAQLSGIHDPRETQAPIYLAVTPLAHPGRPGREYIPAALTRLASLDDLDRLAPFPGLDEKAQVELVRAARSYATGLWWANEDPNQAWLQFVTAIEIAAKQRQVDTGEPVALVEQLWPDLWATLKDADEAVRAGVAEQLAPQMRATKRFVDFLADCAPDPHEVRPRFDHLDWSKISKHARLIYGHRSQALHGGKPFPLPMLERPDVEESGAVQEIPHGLNTGGQGGVWDKREAPMLLSTFEHLTRGALLTWWDELAKG